MIAVIFRDFLNDFIDARVCAERKRVEIAREAFEPAESSGEFIAHSNVGNHRAIGYGTKVPYPNGTVFSTF